ncbi:MAG TPA: hypothetical protein VFB29_00350 [Pseudolabrys sp.]|nr:hypothetical protein [Pseudolabrys sp.]
MARLSSLARKQLPARDFAGPNRSFPINDKTHARLAISGATRSERAGNISPEREAEIKRKARAKLGEGKGRKPRMVPLAALGRRL